MILRIVVPVWGKSYCDFFVHYALPTLFSATALKISRPSVEGIELHIYSTPEDWSYIKNSTEFKHLLKATLVQVRFCKIKSGHENNFLALTWCHQNAIIAGQFKDIAYFFSNADSVFAHGAIDRCLDLAEQGFRAVMTAGLRAKKGPLIQALQANGRLEDGSIKFPPRDLVAVCLKNLHSISCAHLATEYGNYSLGHYYWQIENAALLARCFHVHPLFLWPRNKGVRITTTIDHELVRLSVPDENEVWLVQDSDDIFACEGSDENHLSDYISTKPIVPPEVVDWASIWTNKLHRKFATQSIVFRTSDIRPTQKDEDKASALINSYLAGLSIKFSSSIPDGMVLFKNTGGASMQSSYFKSLLKNTLVRIGRVMTSPATQEIGSRLEKFDWQFEKLNARLRQLNSVNLAGGPTRETHNVTSDPIEDLVPASARFQINEEVPDPTLRPPPGYTLTRGRAVYREAFTKCIEFIWGNQIRGDILEFGTFRGYSARIIAELMVEYELAGDLYLYDSFQGLPNILSSSNDSKSYEVAVTRAWLPGAMAVDQSLPEHLRKVLGQILKKPIHLYEGFFEETLPKGLPSGRAALVHVDCDLYQSTRTVLDSLLQHEILQDGTVICFDDFNCNRANPNMGERRAAVDSFSLSSQYALTPWFSYGWHGQVMFVHDKNAAAGISAYKPQ